MLRNCKTYKNDKIFKYGRIRKILSPNLKILALSEKTEFQQQGLRFPGLVRWDSLRCFFKQMYDKILTS